jgi:hypothetical protein
VDSIIAPVFENVDGPVSRDTLPPSVLLVVVAPTDSEILPATPEPAFPVTTPKDPVDPEVEVPVYTVTEPVPM